MSQNWRDYKREKTVISQSARHDVTVLVGSGNRDGGTIATAWPTGSG